MKVENNPTQSIALRKTEQAQAAARSEGTHSAGKTTQRDRAELSENARLLASARAAFDTVPGASEEKLAELRDAVQNGTYSVPVQDLARAIAARLKLRE